MFVECPAYSSIRAKYEGDLVFQGRSTRISMSETPLLALAVFFQRSGLPGALCYKGLRA